VQHERHKIGLGSGEIVSLVKDGNQITGLKLMEKFDISNERDYWVEYFVVDGGKPRVIRKQIKSVGQYTDTLMFAAPIDISETEKIPVFGNILSALYGPLTNGGLDPYPPPNEDIVEDINVATVWEAKRYIVTDLSENLTGYDLTFAEYAEDIYNDSEISEIEERQSSIQNAPPLVFADQQRNEQQALIETLKTITSPPYIDSISRQVSRNTTEQTTAEFTPRYRGVYYVAGLDDGTIDGDRMNPMDWVLYMGNDGEWQKDYCYRWTIDGKWVQIPYDDMGYYMAALGDITEGRDNGRFMAVFCRLLWAQKAMIDRLEAELIIIRKGGGIQSWNWDGINGGKGFWIDGDTGNVYFINGTFIGFRLPILPIYESQCRYCRRYWLSQYQSSCICTRFLQGPF